MFSSQSPRNVLAGLVEAVHAPGACYVQVDDPHSSAMYEKHGVADGQFVFTTKEAGEYKTCFTARGGCRRTMLAGHAVRTCGLLAQGQGSTSACAHLAQPATCSAWAHGGRLSLSPCAHYVSTRWLKAAEQRANDDARSMLVVRAAGSAEGCRG